MQALFEAGVSSMYLQTDYTMYWELDLSAVEYVYKHTLLSSVLKSVSLSY